MSAGEGEGRRRVASGSPLEREIGLSRAVRAGRLVCVAGTAPVAPGRGGAGVAAPGDVRGQTRRCIAIIAAALAELGGSLEHVVRTRVMLTAFGRWREAAAAAAHGEALGAVRPASTFVEVARFIDPAWLVEVEADAVLPDPAA